MNNHIEAPSGFAINFSVGYNNETHCLPDLASGI